MPKKRSRIRFEYKVFIFFMSLFFLYLPYHFFIKEGLNIGEMIGGFSGGSSSKKTEGVEHKSSAKTIKDSISSERPLILSEDDFKKQIEEIGLTEADIFGVESATDSNTSAVWVYMRNDGVRKDDIALKFCTILRLQGSSPTSVLIMDSAERKKGKIIELGEARCF